MRLSKTFRFRGNDVILSSGRKRLGDSHAIRFCPCPFSVHRTCFRRRSERGRIKTEIIGQTIEWWENDGWHSGNLTLLPDGRAAIEVERPSASSEDGRWTIRGNLICTSWAAIRGGEEKCYSLRRVSDDRFETSGGNVFLICDGWRMTDAAWH